MSDLSRFTIRVYGIMEHNNHVLLVHEKIGDFSFTKFPGGGLELGEGTRQCLKREYKEEANIDIEVGEHVYTTDFFQQSAFRHTDQLVSVYYKVIPLQNPENIVTDEIQITIDGRTEWLRFFWVHRQEINESMLTFPIDKLVCKNYFG